MLKYQTSFIEKSIITELSNSGKKHVVVVGGGMSAEREVSLISSAGVNKALVDAGYKVTFVDMGADIASVLSAIKPDVVYNSLHGTYGEDGCFPGLLNILRIPYTHSGVLASALAFNKIHSKAWFIANNIKTAKSIIINKHDNISEDPMPRPYVIKPLTQGSSIGVEVIFQEDRSIERGTKVLSLLNQLNISSPLDEQVSNEDDIDDQDDVDISAEEEAK